LKMNRLLDGEDSVEEEDAFVKNPRATSVS
jgi:hypothetical protein